MHLLAYLLHPGHSEWLTSGLRLSTVLDSWSATARPFSRSWPSCCWLDGESRVGSGCVESWFRRGSRWRSWRWRWQPAARWRHWWPSGPCLPWVWRLEKAGAVEWWCGRRAAEADISRTAPPRRAEVKVTRLLSAAKVKRHVRSR